MKKLLLLALCSSVLCSQNKAFAQGTERCANNLHLNNLLTEHPEYAPQRQHWLNHIQAQNESILNNLSGLKPEAKTTATQYTIPVVFHVILTQAKLNQLGGTAGVRTRMISQVESLSKDFMGLNADSVNIPSAFKPLFGKSDITFSPAHRTPDNQATEGFEILVTNTASFSASSGSSGLGSDCKYTATGGLAAWDPMRYYNVWVVDISEAGILGYAVPPSYTAFFGIPTVEAGVVLDYGTFGRRSSFTQFFSPSSIDLGRTLTHETGHFFELQHIFGENGACPNAGDVDDGISDTPPQADAVYSPNSSSCRTFPMYDACTSTGNGIMWMNYMDYSDDKCLLLFTKGQVNLMRAQFNAGQPSPIIWSLGQHPEGASWPTDVAAVPQEASLNIYPNPTSGQFEISMADSKGLEGITITNMMGQVVKTINTANPSINNYHIDLTGFSKGVYMVQCNFASGTITKKIVLQ